MNMCVDFCLDLYTYMNEIPFSYRSDWFFLLIKGLAKSPKLPLAASTPRLLSDPQNVAALRELSRSNVSHDHCDSLNTSKEVGTKPILSPSYY